MPQVILTSCHLVDLSIQGRLLRSEYAALGDWYAHGFATATDNEGQRTRKTDRWRYRVAAVPSAEIEPMCPRGCTPSNCEQVGPLVRGRITRP